jgi:hypothetical protein
MKKGGIVVYQGAFKFGFCHGLVRGLFEHGHNAQRFKTVLYQILLLTPCSQGQMNKQDGSLWFRGEFEDGVKKGGGKDNCSPQ